MSDWHDLLPLSELPVGAVKRFEISGEPIAVANTAEGVFAVSDTCSHAEVSLSDGEVNGCLIECWMHGASFDLRTGAPTGPPATKAIEVFPVQIHGENAMISVQVSGI